MLRDVKILTSEHPSSSNSRSFIEKKTNIIGSSLCTQQGISSYKNFTLKECTENKRKKHKTPKNSIVVSDRIKNSTHRRSDN